MQVFRSSASRFHIQIWVFPVHYYENVSKAEMEKKSLRAEIPVNLPQGYKGNIQVYVALWHRTETFRVPVGQALREVLVQNKKTLHHVAFVSRPKPERDPHSGHIKANSYDVTSIWAMDALQDMPQVPYVTTPITL